MLQVGVDAHGREEALLKHFIQSRRALLCFHEDDLIEIESIKKVGELVDFGVFFQFLITKER